MIEPAHFKWLGGARGAHRDVHMCLQRMLIKELSSNGQTLASDADRGTQAASAPYRRPIRGWHRWGGWARPRAT